MSSHPAGKAQEQEDEVNSSSQELSSTSTTSAAAAARPRENTVDYLPATAQRDLRLGAVRRAREKSEQENKDKAAQRASVGDVQKLKSKRPDLAHIVTEDLRRYPDAVAASLNDSSSSNAAGGTTTSASDAIFAQLHIIQSLQDDITREHKRLENLSDDLTSPASDKGRNAGDNPLVHSSSSVPLSSSAANRGGPTPQPQAAAAAGQGTATTASGRRDGGNKSSATDRSAAEAYDKLAAGFHERAKGVDAIMEKMARLSQAVKDFHSLPPPISFPEQTVMPSAQVVETPTMLSPVNRIA